MLNKAKWLVLILFVVGCFARAGLIAPDLNAKLSFVPADEKIPVIVVLREQVPLRVFAYQPSALIVSLRQTAETTQQDLLSFLHSAQGRGEAENIKSFWIVNAVSFKGTRSLIEAIAERADVDIVEPDRVIHLPPERRSIPITTLQAYEWNILKIRAPEVWAQGITGKGVLVGIIDTGVDVTHPVWLVSGGQPTVGLIPRTRLLPPQLILTGTAPIARVPSWVEMQAGGG